LIFKRKRYYFNRETLKYVELKPDKSFRNKVLSVYIISFHILIISGGYIINNYFKSPKYSLLERKAEILQNNLHDIMQKATEYEKELHENYFISDNTYRTILEIDTLPLSMRYGGTGGALLSGSAVYSTGIGYQLNTQLEKLNTQLNIQTESYNIVYEKAVEYDSRWNHLPAIMPLSEENLLYVSSYFGTRQDPFSNNNEQIHSGIDFVAETGTEVYSTAEGIVTLLHFSRTGYGNEILIDHAFGYSTRYAHLAEILVEEGQTIKRGQLIGRVGSSGRSTGPHLHYEVRFDNRALNPLNYFHSNISTEEYREILVMANKQLTTN